MIWVIGAGAIGMLYAARMAMAHIPVVLVTRTSEQARCMEQDNVLLLADGREARVAIPAFAGAEAIDRMRHMASPEWFLLTVKQTSLNQTLCGELGGWAARTGATMIAMQNGIGHLEMLSEYVPAGQLMAAVSTEGARRTGMAAVEHTGHGETRIGWAVGREGADTGSLVNLMNALERAGFRTSLSKDMRNELWRKCLINAVINPLTALYEVSNGELPLHKERLARMRRLFDEGLQVARAEGCDFGEPLWETVLQICRDTATNESSMLQDVRAGRQTEIEAINGQLLARGERCGLSLEENRTVVRQIKNREAGVKHSS